jgi:hypothetical protein
MCLIIDSQYFPSVAYTKMLFAHSHIKIELYNWHRKNSFRNRCRVAGSNGVILLSVPLENGRDQKALFRDLRISYQQNWVLHHWRTIMSCYSRAPFYEYYAPDIQVLLEKRFRYLYDLNWHIALWLQRITGLQAAITQTADYLNTYPSETYTDRRGQVSMDDEALPPYYQLFEDRIGFQPNLSIIDLLFMEGPGTGNYLRL